MGVLGLFSEYVNRQNKTSSEELGIWFNGS